jgi:hypothetical protein
MPRSDLVLMKWLKGAGEGKNWRDQEKRKEA